MSPPRTIAVYYEHPDWFRPLFDELDRRELPYVRVDASRFQFDPAEGLGAVPWTNGAAHRERPALVFNRMSPSAWKRGRAHAILYTLHYLRYLEQSGVPVVNGVRAFTVETSKALQVSLIHRLGLRAPRTRVVNHPSELPAASEHLEFPLVVKPNIGGSGAGIARFNTKDELEDAVSHGRVSSSIDSILLLQEFHPSTDGSIVRVETLDGRYLYGIRVHIEEGAGYDLCPADICRDTSGNKLESAACPANAVKSGLTVEAYEPPAEIIEQVERLSGASGLDVGGIEYLESARDGRRYFYDLNALSNFVAEPRRVLGFDPHANLVDFLVGKAGVAPREARPRVAATVAVGANGGLS